MDGDSTKIVVEPLGSLCRWIVGSGISEIQYSHLGLRVVVSAADWSVYGDFAGNFVDVFFPRAWAFQAMDEADLGFELERRSPGSATGYVVYQVIRGGWRDRAPEGFINITRHLEYDEWLVVSDALCVSVIGRKPPLIREHNNEEP